MTSIKWILTLTCFVIVQAAPAPDDPGPHVFENNLPSAPSNKQRGYVMKEVTLYLTPSQIKALEASKSDKKLSNQSDGQRFSEQDLQKLEAEIKKQLERQHIYLSDQSDIQRPVKNFYNPPLPVEEPTNENPLEYLPKYQQKWTPIPKIQEDLKYFAPVQVNHQNPNTKFPESYSFVKIYTDEKVYETPKFQLFHPIPHQHQSNDWSKLFEVQRDPLHSKEYKLIPYEYLPDHSPGAPKPEEVKELSKWITALEKYENPHPHVKNLLGPQVTEVHENQEEKIEQHPLNYFKEEPYLKYAPNFEEQKHVDEYHNFVIKIEKENALARTKAILKASPERKEIPTKRRTSSGNRHVSSYLGSEKSPFLRHDWKL